tara:strand:- start:67745 stop:68200 length:456 start_codon:yes stop_codon:yes gene_type:complete
MHLRTVCETSKELVDALYNRDLVSLNHALLHDISVNSCLKNTSITPLHFATILQFGSAIDLLIEAGADVAATTQVGSSSLNSIQIAKLFGYKAIEDRLIYWMSVFNRQSSNTGSFLPQRKILFGTTWKVLKASIYRLRCDRQAKFKEKKLL